MSRWLATFLKAAELLEAVKIGPNVLTQRRRRAGSDRRRPAWQIEHRLITHNNGVYGVHSCLLNCAHFRNRLEHRFIGVRTEYRIRCLWSEKHSAIAFRLPLQLDLSVPRRFPARAGKA